MRNVIKQIPDNILSDDAYMSQLIFEKGFHIKYSPEAKVYVKFPTTFKDWILQKRRSGGGTIQLKYFFKKTKKMRTFWSESFWGLLTAFYYPKTIREVWYTFCLFFARLYLWLTIGKTIKKDVNLIEVWKEVK